MNDEQEYCLYSLPYKKFIHSFINKPALNLGCSIFKIDATNVDYNENVKPDVLHDLNKFPYPFENESFNSIFLLDVLEHLKHPEKTVGECFRILKNGGILFVAVPSERSRYYRHRNHIQFFDKKGLMKLMDNFNVRIFGYAGNTRNIPTFAGKIAGKLIGNEWVCIGKKIKSGKL
jgi:SAM-dependent methyltransferase